MPGPKEEWLIWDQLFRLEFNSLNQRLKKTEEATQQISQLDQQNQTLAASNKHLQEENNELRDKIQQLEQSSYSIVKLDEQVQDLTASTKHLQRDNDELRDRIQQLEQSSHSIVKLNKQIQDLKFSSSSLKEGDIFLNDRILQLEQEGNHGVQVNRMAQGQLKANLSVLEDAIEHLNDAMSGMNATVKEVWGRLIAIGHTRGTTDASRETSQANILDESVPSKQHAGQQQLLPNAVHQDIEVQSVTIKAQSSSTLLENHLRYTEKAVKRYETEAVQAFVSGLQEQYRIPLGNKLEEHDEWTWQVAMEEGYKMVEGEKKTRRRSARLMSGAFQPS